jgi:hypothetical protein
VPPLLTAVSGPATPRWLVLTVGSPGRLAAPWSIRVHASARPLLLSVLLSAPLYPYNCQVPGSRPGWSLPVVSWKLWTAVGLVGVTMKPEPWWPKLRYLVFVSPSSSFKGPSPGLAVPWPG